MAKTKPTKTKNNSFDSSGLDVLALILAGFFTQSVLTTFHNAAYNQFVGPPSWPVLVTSIAITAYTVNKAKKFSKLSVITLTVLAVSTLFWVSGLRANFFF